MRYWPLEKVCLLLSLALLACSSSESPAGGKNECNDHCQDEIAARSLREILKLVYNITLQGNDVGEQDETTKCPHGGNARVFGSASSVAAQGANKLDLTFELAKCTYLRRDDDAKQSYHVTLSGTVAEWGTLAVQPTSTTALSFEADAITLEGDVFSPSVDYQAVDCAVRLAQNGSYLSGSWCGRDVGFDL